MFPWHTCRTAEQHLALPWNHFAGLKINCVSLACRQESSPNPNAPCHVASSSSNYGWLTGGFLPWSDLLNDLYEQGHLRWKESHSYSGDLEEPKGLAQGMQIWVLRSWGQEHPCEYSSSTSFYINTHPTYSSKDISGRQTGFMTYSDLLQPVFFFFF